MPIQASVSWLTSCFIKSPAYAANHSMSAVLCRKEIQQQKIICRQTNPTDFPLYAIANLTEIWGEKNGLDIHYDNDYLVPLLLSNPQYQGFFAEYFPSREVFHPLARFLFKLHPRHESVAQEFRNAHFGKFTVGIQIRTRKPVGLKYSEVAHFCALARAAQLKRGMSDDYMRGFVSADSSAAIEAVRDGLGAERVVAVDAGGVRDEAGTIKGRLSSR